MTIGLVDLERQREALEPGLTNAVLKVLAHGAFVGGPEVAALQAALETRVGVPHVVPCANGTDALQLLLRASDIGAGDCVFVPSLTFAATAEAVLLVGAEPMFVDVLPDAGTICPQSLSRAIDAVKAEGRLCPRAAIAVDLYSIPADYQALDALCRSQGLLLFSDAAHSIGTTTPTGNCGAFGDGAATSFYPSKALGCYGDGGAVFTRDPGLAERLRSIANHGVTRSGPAHERVGTNSRLDSLQAAVLLEKLKVFDDELGVRREIAASFIDALDGLCGLPVVAPGVAPAWSYFAIRHPARDRLKQHLEARGIRAVTHYATPMHDQPAFAASPVAPGGLPATRAFADSLLCLPLHPYLSHAERKQIIDGLLSFLSTSDSALAAHGFG